MRLLRCKFVHQSLSEYGLVDFLLPVRYMVHLIFAIQKSYQPYLAQLQKEPFDFLEFLDFRLFEAEIHD